MLTINDLIGKTINQQCNLITDYYHSDTPECFILKTIATNNMLFINHAALARRLSEDYGFDDQIISWALSWIKGKLKEGEICYTVANTVNVINSTQHVTQSVPSAPIIVMPDLSAIRLIREGYLPFRMFLDELKAGRTIFIISMDSSKTVIKACIYYDVNSNTYFDIKIKNTDKGYELIPSSVVRYKTAFRLMINVVFKYLFSSAATDDEDIVLNSGKGIISKIQTTIIV
jgi:hypothetical protein